MHSEIHLLAWLIPVIFLAAALYASVGHGGASAYLAVLSLAGLATAFIKPCALSLNIAVSGLALALFWRAGHVPLRRLWPLVLASAPAAFLGGCLHVNPVLFKILLALALMAAAWRLVLPPAEAREVSRDMRWRVALPVGGIVGLVSGLVGVGGGIFLTPLLILGGWAGTKEASGLSAAFIFINSLAGLAGFMVQGGHVPLETLGLLPAVVAGGALGAAWGSGVARPLMLRRALGVVLIIAAVKFVLV